MGWFLPSDYVLQKTILFRKVVEHIGVQHLRANTKV